jgi:hypothetical protein
MSYVKDNFSRLFLTPFYSLPMRFAGTFAGTFLLRGWRCHADFFCYVGQLAALQHYAAERHPRSQIGGCERLRTRHYKVEGRLRFGFKASVVLADNPLR